MTIEAKARELLLDGDRETIDGWRAEDERHDRAYRDAQLAWNAIGRTSFARDHGWRAEAKPRPRWTVPAAMAASLAIAAVIAPQVMGAPARELRTEVAETQQVTLADGAKVFVGAKSAVDLRMDEDSRTAVLKGGEAFFEVADDPARPFTVNAEPGGWRQGRMQYADAPLKEVVADANRYSQRPIRLASNDLGDMRVTVSFRTKAVDELIANLDAGLPVSVSTQADGDIVLTAEPRSAR